MTQGSLPIPELSFGKCRTRIRLSERVAALARRLWPSKTAINLASRGNVTTRTAELWLEGRNDISGYAIVELLRSDVGYELLQELMEGSSTRWWRDFKRGVEIQELENKIEWQSRALAKLTADFTG